MERDREGTYIQTYFLATCLLPPLTAGGNVLAGQDVAGTDRAVQQMVSAVWETGIQLDNAEILPGN